ncbi:MAG: Bug family tripartite tricarboxylate transporter substrate binding protein [Betaproteobacteria bacterium]|jgi:tripartite-type tricarboxylate transporter receptor subunit TctC|nr:tripartite tricarboxylate transporter substrate binding protein [Burkholderiales bacterium]MCA3214808.1 tripartite tricarboxylate transporter substrate binding protein [Burkholderiales bacterium]
MHRRAAVVLLAATALGMHARGASAQAYPARPIRLVVPFPPGGPLDSAARALAERMKDGLGTVVVENRPGAGGNLGVDYVAKQPADGYTLVIGAVATHAINPWLFAKLPYDPVKDFAPVSLIAHVPNVLVMTPETATRLGVNSLGELVAYMKKQPGRLNYASGGNGSAGHMAGELLKSTAGLFAVHIPYAGAAPAQLGLLAGQTDFMFDNLASAAPQIRAGRLRAFAVTTRTRAASFPDLPTMGEAGGASLKGFDISTWFGVLAPAGTPAPIVDQLSAAMRAALTSAEMRERLARMGAEPAPSTPAGFAALIQSELAKYREIVRFSGAKVD